MREGAVAMELVADVRGDLAANLKNIHGWFSEDEAWRLFCTARSVAARRPGAVAVEIGSWLGRSTIALAMGLRAGGGGRLYAIDPHQGGEEHAMGVGPIDSFDAFLQNLQNAGVADVVEPIRTTSHVARSRFDVGQVDLLFVDGSHHYPDVITDMEDWIPTLRVPGHIAFNDPSHPGVYKVLCERVAVRRAPFRNAALVSNTVFLEYRPDLPWTGRAEGQRRRLRAVLWVRYVTSGLRPYFPLPVVRLAHRILGRALGPA